MDMEKLAEKVAIKRAEDYDLKWERLTPIDRHNRWANTKAELEALTALGYSIAGPDEVVVERDALEDLLAFYEIEDEAHIPGSDAWMTRHRADIALNPHRLAAAEEK